LRIRKAGRLEILEFALAISCVCLEDDGADSLFGGPVENLVLVWIRHEVELDEEDLEATVVDVGQDALLGGPRFHQVVPGEHHQSIHQLAIGIAIGIAIEWPDWYRVHR